MSRPNPIPNSKPFPKGVSGNPNGRPKKLVSKMKKYGYKRAQVQDTLQNMIGLNLAQLKAVYDDPDSTVLEKALASAIRKSIESGKLDSIDMIFTRLYGHPKQTVDNTHSNPDGGPVEIKRTVVFKNYGK